jgi:hypothetical protein
MCLRALLNLINLNLPFRNPSRAKTMFGHLITYCNAHANSKMSFVINLLYSGQQLFSISRFALYVCANISLLYYEF